MKVDAFFTQKGMSYRKMLPQVFCKKYFLYRHDLTLKYYFVINKTFIAIGSQPLERSSHLTLCA